MLEAKCFCVNGSKLGMIAAATFGNVMKHATQVGDLGFFERLHDAAASREFVIETRQCESTQVADDKQ